MKRLNWIDAIEQIAVCDWGIDTENDEAAMKNFVNDPQRVAAFGIIALLARLSGRKLLKKTFRDVERPTNAKRFPGAKIGELLYSADLDGCGSKWVIVAVNDDYCRIVDAGGKYDQEWSHQVIWACDFHFRSVREAVLESAKNDEEYATYALAKVAKAKEMCAGSSSDQEILDWVLALE